MGGSVRGFPSHEAEPGSESMDMRQPTVEVRVIMNAKRNGKQNRESRGSGTDLMLWGGLECTINRVQDQYFSQLERNGHVSRQGDIESFASLGIRAIRYPVLWEHVAPKGLDEADWALPDARLPALREHGIASIVGLVHHGSGPSDTSLVDARFPERLAEYAGAVARRYP